MLARGLSAQSTGLCDGPILIKVDCIGVLTHVMTEYSPYTIIYENKAPYTDTFIQTHSTFGCQSVKMFN